MVIELPSWRGPSDSPGRVIDVIDAWATGVAMRELVASFGGRLPTTNSLPWLDSFSAEHWDFRNGRERNLANPAQLTDAQEAVLLDVAADLGLSGQESPSRVDYDAVVMTGGMVRAGIVKPRHVAALLRNGLRSPRVVFLGGFRPFAGDELEVATALGMAGDNEFAAMATGMERAFGPLSSPEIREGENWREDIWRIADVTLSVVAAPSSVPGRRANSSDTYRFWASNREASVRSALIVTTPIYVPYQGAAAVEVLGLEYGLTVETVATSAAANDLGAHSQAFLPAHQLQELRSAVRGMLSLRLRLAAAAA